MTVSLTFRVALLQDADLLAGLNSELIQDEGHWNQMTRPELTDRMCRWLEAEYQGVIFEANQQVAAYALYCFGEQAGEEFVFLRQFLVRRSFRRQGIGREAMRVLMHDIWPPENRVILDVLVHNEEGRAFWTALGFQPLSVTLINRPWRPGLPSNHRAV